MDIHENAKLTPQSRAAIVRRVSCCQGGLSQAQSSSSSYAMHAPHYRVIRSWTVPDLPAQYRDRDRPDRERPSDDRRTR